MLFSAKSLQNHHFILSTNFCGNPMILLFNLFHFFVKAFIVKGYEYKPHSVGLKTVAFGDARQGRRAGS